MAVDSNVKSQFDQLMSAGKYDDAANLAKQQISAGNIKQDEVASYVGSNSAWNTSPDQANGFLSSYMAKTTPDQAGYGPVISPEPSPSTTPAQTSTPPLAPQNTPKADGFGPYTQPSVAAPVSYQTPTPTPSPAPQTTVTPTATPQLMRNSKYAANDPHVLAAQTLAQAAIGNQFGNITDADSLISAYNQRKAKGAISPDELKHWKFASYLMGIDPNSTTDFNGVEMGAGSGQANDPYTKALAAYAKAAGYSNVTDRASLISAYDSRIKNGQPMSDGEAENWKVAAQLAGIDTTGFDFKSGSYTKSQAAAQPAGQTAGDNSSTGFVDPNKVPLYSQNQTVASRKLGGALTTEPQTMNDAAKSLMQQYMANNQLDKAAALGRSYGYSDQQISDLVAKLYDNPTDAKNAALASFQYLTEHPGANNSTVQDRLTGLLDQDGQYMQQARNGAMAAANDRGLLNSSIAAGAGQEAAIKSALPIAQQDATAFAQQDIANQQAANNAYNNEYQAKSSQFGTQQAAATDALNKAELQKRAFLNDSSLSAQSSEQAKSLAGYQNQLDITKANAVSKLNMTEAEQKAFLQMDINKQQNVLDIQKIDAQAASDYAKALLSSQTELQKANIASSTDIQTAGISASAQQAIASLKANNDYNISKLDSETKLKGYSIDESIKLKQIIADTIKTSGDTSAKILGNDTGASWTTKVAAVDNYQLNQIGYLNSIQSSINGTKAPVVTLPPRDYANGNDSLRPLSVVMNSNGFFEFSASPNTAKETAS